MEALQIELVEKEDLSEIILFLLKLFDRFSSETEGCSTSLKSLLRSEQCPLVTKRCCPPRTSQALHECKNILANITASSPQLCKKGGDMVMRLFFE